MNDLTTNVQDLSDLSDRAGRLIGAVASSMMSAMESAAARIEEASSLAAEKTAFAAEVAKVQARMSAFASVLESVGEQKAAIASRMESAPAPVKALLGAQLQALTRQELNVLVKVGVAQDVALIAVQNVDGPTHRRDGRRFTREVPLNGH